MLGRRRGTALSPLLVLLFALVAALGVVQYVRAVPELQLTQTIPPTSVIGGQPVGLPLPTAGAAALYVGGLDVLGASGSPTPRPIASVTKMMTAYVILREHPLSIGQQGPAITITAADAAAYARYIAEDQSAIPLSAGQLSLYQMLQALLIPSGNNVAEILARWNAGSVEAFVAKMNATAAALGMHSTRYADASGPSPGNLSTPEDQLTLALEAMRNPVFAQVVSQTQVQLPGSGLHHNVNALLGQEGIVGVKTGFTEEAGGCYVFAARRDVGGRTVEFYGVVLGQPTRQNAFDVALRLLATAGGGVQLAPVVTQGQAVATLESAWGDRIDLVAAENAEMLVWPGMALRASVQVEVGKAPVKGGQEVGVLVLELGEQRRQVPLVAATSLGGAPLLWRLTRL
jgi:D-alanyl-D-alanine carboxypeptidase (penicillin-binding protein 5/6)